MRAAADSLTYRLTNVPRSFHVAQPSPVLTPPARYW